MHTKKTKSVALIGCGNIGSALDEVGSREKKNSITHAAAIYNNPYLTLSAVSDKSDQRANECANYWGVSHAYNDSKQLIDSGNYDLLVIASPPEDRIEIIQYAINSGIGAFFVEKPFASTTTESQRLLSLTQEHNIICGVNYFRRWSSIPNVLQNTFNTFGGAEGIQRIQCLYGKGLINNASHLIDLLSIFIGHPKKGYAKQSPFTCNDDYLSPDLSLEYKLGGKLIPCSLHSIDHNNYSLLEIDIIHNSGRVRILDGGNIIEVSIAKEHEEYKGYKHLRPLKVYTDCLSGALNRAYEEWVTVLETKNSPFCQAADGHNVLQALSNITYEPSQSSPQDA
ncbi:dehydrogenase like protein [gamma proteobacterium IMCC1989]|nr:dehydrogenase like protein [gamma proteobacterium IMCC1989]